MSEPNPVLKIVLALVDSKDGRLTPHVSEQNGKRYSYHLNSVRCLGSILRDSRTFIVAAVGFVRSTSEGGDLPPARGHGFLLLIDDKNQISACGLDFPDQVEMRGTKLFRMGKLPSEAEGAEIGDLGASKSRGFLIDGSEVLPNPFSDRAAQDSKGDQGSDQSDSSTEPK